MHEYHDAAVLTVLNLSFLADMLADALSSSQAVVSFNGRMFHQYLYGIIAIFVAVIIVGLYLSYRYYQLAGEKLNSKTLLSYSVLSLTILGFGIFLYFITYSVVIISYSFFMPALFGLFFVMFEIYKQNGFRVLTRAELRTPSAAPFWAAFWSKGLPVVDYFMVFSLVAFWLLLGGLGWTVSTYNTPSWVGWVSVMSILVLITSFLPLYEYFQILEFSVNFIVQLLISFAALTIMLAVIYVDVLYKTADNTSAILLFVFFMYPILILAFFALYYWRDNNWELTSFVKIALGVVAVLIFAFLILLTAIVTPWTSGAAALLGYLLLAYVGVVLGVWYNNRFFLPPLWRYSVLFAVAVTLAFGIGLGMQANSGFAGFSVIVAVVMLYFVVQIVTINRHAKLDNNMFIWSAGVFPVYLFSPKPGVKDPLSPVRIHTEQE
jgi:hypothetical protein